MTITFGYTKKAFDRVDHVILLDRLHDAGIRGRAWLWVRSFLSGRLMRTVDGSECSSWHRIGYGVPQGCVLSPLLFLVFINDAAMAIVNDAACKLVRPNLFADDGAIVPVPLLEDRPNKPTALADNAAYIACMNKAIGHLDRWCSNSRMQFGPDKTKLLLFHAGKKALSAVDLAPYQHFQVCGFTIGLSASYTYLGIDLTARNLSWTRHVRRALDAGRTASARVMRIALRAKEPSFAAIRTLTLGFVIPSCMYGAQFWARSLSETDDRRFQAKFAAPLRAALHLPTTTHQLGTLVMCGVPSVREEVVKDELRFLRHYHRLRAEDPASPTVKVVQAYTKYLLEHVPREVLVPMNKLYTVSHADITTVPDVLDPGPAGLVRHLSPAQRNSLHLPPAPACIRTGVTFWEVLGADRWSRHPPSVFSQGHLKELRTFSRAASAHLDPPIIGRLGHWTTFRQWERQHAPLPAAQQQQQQQQQQQDPADHLTSAPLTTCQTAPGRAFFLGQGGSYPSITRRSRLLTRRAYTQETRHRFAKASDPVVASCSYAPCAAASVTGAAPPESVDHALLHCLRYSSARQLLSTTMQTLAVPLSLSSILLASVPAGLRKAQRSVLLASTDAFLDAVDATRRAVNGLLPLDAG